MALVNSKRLSLGSPIIDFSLMEVSGNRYSLSNFDESTIFVIVFTCNHCPYAQAIENRLIDLQNKYADDSVQVIAINSNDAFNYPDDSFENMQVISEEKNYPFLYLFDETQNVAISYNAQCTPDLYVYDYDRKLAYHGRFDDNWQNPDEVKSHDLEDAIKAIIKSEYVNADQKPSMGCSIKWK